MNEAMPGDPLWQKVKPDQLGTEAELDYLQQGDPFGTLFSIGEADVSLRPGWFTMRIRIPSLSRSWLRFIFTR